MKTKKRIKSISIEVEKLVKLLNKKVIVADIATDHGYIAESVSHIDNVDRVIATDISVKCLEKIKKLIEVNNLTNIDAILGDGLIPIDKVDIAVIAGIGGFEIMKIIKNQNITNNNKLKCQYFILQPAQNVIELREWIIKNRFTVISDFIIEDSNKFYPIIVIDVFNKSKLTKNIFNVWFGRDNKIENIDFVNFLKNEYELLSFISKIPKIKLIFNKSMREKYKVYHLIEKLLNLC